jgi:hypothetical protein
MKRGIHDKGQSLNLKIHLGVKNRRHFLTTAVTSLAGVFIAPPLLAAYQENYPIKQEDYPDPSIVILDKRFEKYVQINAAVERLWTGARWAEGPVWFGDGRYLLFSDIPNNVILRWTEETGKVSKFKEAAVEYDFTLRPGEKRAFRFKMPAIPTALARSQAAPDAPDRLLLPGSALRPE